MPLSLVQRLLRSLAPRPLQLGGPVRAEVRPPLRHRAGSSWRRRFSDWLASGLGDSVGTTVFHDWRPAGRKDPALDKARAAFRGSLADIVTPRAGICLDHIRTARSLHELWHLRAEVFSLVSCHHSQGEADRRLRQVDRHFPSKGRRAGFVASRPPT